MGTVQDRRSPEAAAYRKLYSTRRWKVLRRDQLRREPLCRMCRRRGLIVQATRGDHIKPHRGDLALFFDPDNLQSLCQPCHDGPKQVEDLRGFSAEVDAGGWPIDPQHPAYR